LRDKRISRGILTLTNKGGEKGITIFSSTLYSGCYSEVIAKKLLGNIKKEKKLC